VVLVISHDAEGSFGLILNRPLGAVLGDVLPEVSDQGSSIPVHHGGPVQTDLVQFVSRSAPAEPSLLPGVSVGVSLEELLEHAAEGQAVRCYVGYSGWGAGQLEAETAEGSWIVAPARAEHVFDVPAEIIQQVYTRQPPREDLYTTRAAG